ncbi:hypothetical protein B0T44_16085 [Nocardia donostiensis]|uniref:Uncharacterized protein n=1 Tax=Nocardia donostiensis TaxID=1538463 RepID=A0A1V2TC44_9NOCA|nr:hypothetical protein B0T46_20785 [Nocardia donostiensis]OQS13260.1 hypothetical protein B0T36_20830 [Nocardia donostiensis]OQS19170.1 hypothetical protein B0T44_16085 [Nocardia donostiensis]
MVYRQRRTDKRRKPQHVELVASVVDMGTMCPSHRVIGSVTVARVGRECTGPGESRLGFGGR